jgi:hypothetical protein
MNQRLLMPILVSVFVLAGLGISRVTAGQAIDNQLPNTVQEDYDLQKPIDPENISFEDDESDPAIEARNIEQEFYGIELTAQQLDQIKQVRRQMRDEFRQVMTTNFGQIMMLMVLPQQQAEQMAGDLFEPPILTYITNVEQILTPAQLQIWQRNFEQASAQNAAQ